MGCTVIQETTVVLSHMLHTEYKTGSNRTEHRARGHTDNMAVSWEQHTNTAMAHKSAEYNTVWSLLETHRYVFNNNILALVKNITWPLTKCYLHSLTWHMGKHINSCNKCTADWNTLGQGTNHINSFFFSIATSVSIAELHSVHKWSPRHLMQVNYTVSLFLETQLDSMTTLAQCN